MPRIGKFTVAMAGLALFGAACVGSVDGGSGSGKPDPSGGSGGRVGGGGSPGSSGGSGGNGGNAGTGGSGGTVAPAAGDPGYAVFRRLTRAEYNNTVRDLLGDTTRPATAFPPDSLAGQSGYNRGGTVSAVDADRLFEAAQKLAGSAVSSKLGDLLPCGQAPADEAGQTSCAKDFISKFGLRAFRRPLVAEEVKAFEDLYTQQRTEVKNDFAGGIRAVLTAMLMSPNFNYRWETVPEALKKDGNFYRFNSYEMASRLSYFIYASMPDQGLFDAAAADKLTAPATIEAEVRRMIKDGKVKEGLGDFIMQLLDVTDLPDLAKSPVYTNYDAAVAEAMLLEAKETLTGVLTGDGKLSTLLTGRTGYVNGKMAAIYGATGVTGDALRKTELNADQRAGILTQGAFLATHAKAGETNPITRGKTVGERVLCKHIPAPPDDIPDPIQPRDGLTTRDRFTMHSSNDACAACHKYIDPLGFAYENYGAVGEWRTIDMGQPVNAADKVEIDGKTVEFKNAVELARAMGDSKDAQDCMSTQLLRFALRRKEVDGDSASLKAAQAAFRDAGGDLRELLVALAKSKSFTHRSASMGEKLLP